jgi:hypothetical protein
MISVELHHLPNQVGAHMKCAPRPAVVLIRRCDDHHTHGQGAISRERQVFGQDGGVSRTSILSGESVLIPKHADGRVPKEAMRTRQDQRPVGRHGGSAARSSMWFRTKSAKSFYQIEVHSPSS